MNRRKGIVWILCAVLLMAALGFAALWRSGADDSENLALRRGVKARCDSTENEELTADRVIDGEDQDRASRWSSANDWDSAEHYIELEFPEEISVSFVVLKWERRNAVHYALEGSADGESYTVLQEFMTAPSEKNQEIALEKAASLRFLRLSVHEVSRKEEDYSNLYQNVSLYEIEVYEKPPAAYLLEEPQIETAADGSRRLTMPEAPEGCEVSFLGADYEQVIGADRSVYDTIQDKEVTVGFLVTDLSGGEQRERTFTLTVPANGAQREQQEQCNEKPTVTPALAEWSGGSGSFSLGAESRILLDGSGEQQELCNVAELLAKELDQRIEGKPGDDRFCGRIMQGSAEQAAAGDIVLRFADKENGLGREGYTVQISDICVISAEQMTGLRWGAVTLLQLYDNCGEQIPQGEIRDYPRFEVRGFGVDVARKAVSLETLRDMVKVMSYYKMNDFGLHLNDNVILATSGLDGSMEEALTAESAFRLESEIVGEGGKRLTSSEYAYTKEELAGLIAEAESYGVQVVPEIDTPAHSLAITSLYPEYALGDNPLWADQIDLENENAEELVRSIWKEALDAETGAFRGADTVNIGMDEYYGDGERYRQYLQEICALVQQYGKKVRLWGSLSNIAGTQTPQTENLQLNIWSMVWADPLEMYHQGYSLINMQNNHLYIIPGGGYDYLDTAELAKSWEPNLFYDYDTMETIPVYSAQMLGAAYMIWNDMSGRLDLKISEADLYDRFLDPLPLLSARLWGEAGAQVDDNEAERIRQTAWKIWEQGAGEAIAPSYEIECRIRLEETDGGQVLARNDSAYGEWAFYAAEPETGKVGFSREGRTYTFDCRLESGKWVTLRLVGELGTTTLYLDGERIGTLGSTEPFEEYATFVFPTQYLGEETGSFRGEVCWTVLEGITD